MVGCWMNSTKGDRFVLLFINFRIWGLHFMFRNYQNYVKTKKKMYFILKVQSKLINKIDVPIFLMLT